MNAEKLTRRSREALEGAQAKALRFGHQEVDGEHLLLDGSRSGGRDRTRASSSGPEPIRRHAEGAHQRRSSAKRPRVTGGSDGGRQDPTSRSGSTSLLVNARRRGGQASRTSTSPSSTCVLAFLAEEQGDAHRGTHPVRAAGASRDTFLGGDLQRFAATSA